MGYKIRKQTVLKQVARLRRHRRVRSKIYGTSERPRLVVFRSLKHIYAQVIDDATSRVLFQSSTLVKGHKKTKSVNTIAGATQIGANIAKKALAKDIKKVVFDTAGYRYHGRVKALAEAARKGGLAF